MDFINRVDKDTIWPEEDLTVEEDALENSTDADLLLLPIPSDPRNTKTRFRRNSDQEGSRFRGMTQEKGKSFLF